MGAEESPSTPRLLAEITVLPLNFELMPRLLMEAPKVNQYFIRVEG